MQLFMKKLEVVIAVVCGVGLFLSILASTAHVVEALTWAHMWPFAVFLGLATVVMNAVLVGITILNKRRNTNETVKTVLLLALILLLSVEVGANLIVAQLYIDRQMPRSVFNLFGENLLGAIWLSAMFPVINALGVYAYAESLVQRVLEAEAAVGEADRLVQDSANLWRPKP
jgi:hypothetical protein